PGRHCPGPRHSLVPRPAPRRRLTVSSQAGYPPSALRPGIRRHPSGRVTDAGHPPPGPDDGRPAPRSALRDRIAGLEAGDSLIPEVGVADSDLLGFEHRVQTELQLALEVAEELECRLLQDEDADDVQPGHEAHADVTERPRAARGRDRTDGDGDEDEQLQ